MLKIYLVNRVIILESVLNENNNLERSDIKWRDYLYFLWV